MADNGDPLLDLVGYRDLTDDGTPIARRSKLNFIGVTVTDNPSTGATDIETVTVGTLTLQGAYDNGPDIDTALGPVVFSTTDNANDTFQVNRSFVGVGDAIQIGMGLAGEAVSGVGLRIRMGANATASALLIDHQGDDTTALVTEATTGTNGASVREFVGDRSPAGNITANPGDIYRRSNATFSDLYLHKGAASGLAGWVTSATHATNVIDVYSTVDFGTAVLAPDGNMRVPIVIGAVYVIHGAVVMPLLLLPEQPVGPPALISFVSTYGNGTLLVADTSAPAIWGRDSVTLICKNIIFVDITNFGAGLGATLLDIVGASAGSTAIGMFECFVVLFKSAGNLVDATSLSTSCRYLNNESGYTLRTNPGVPSIGAISMLGTSIENAAALPDIRRPAASIIGDAGKSSFTHCNVATGKAANSAFYVDPTIVGSLTFVAIAYESVAEDGEFFRPVLSPAITTQANADIAIISFEDSAVNPGVDTQVNFGTIVDFTRGQVVLLADEAAYDGLQTIVRVASDQRSFDINVAIDTFGAGTLKMVQHTVANNQFARDETVVVTESSNNGTAQVLRGTDTTFHLPQAFAAGDTTGIATSTSEDEMSIHLTTSVAGAQRSSASVGSVIATANSTSTVIANINEWTDLDMDGAAFVGSNAELWGSVDADTGEITYEGLPEFHGEMEASLSVTSSGGNQVFQFRAVLNGSPFSDGVVVSVELSNNPMLEVSLLVPVTCFTGDDVRIQTQNTSGTANVLIQDLSFAIK